MNEPLHPLTLAEILDRTAHLYRSRFLVFLGVGMIPAGTVFVFAAGIFTFIAWMGSNARSGASVADVLVWIFLILLLVLVIPASLGASALGAAAMSDAAARSFLGDAITIRGSYQTAWRRGWRYAGLYTLQGLAIIGAPAAVLLLAAIAMSISRQMGAALNGGSVLFSALVFLLVLILGAFTVWMLLRLCLAFPACVVEQATPWRALKRGLLMSQGTRGRILLLYLLGTILNQVLAWAFTVPAMIALALIPALQGPAHEKAAGMIAMFVLYCAFFAVRAFTRPIYGIALTLFYFDQRIRKEGFDIEWMMQQAGLLPAPQASAEPAAEQSPERTPEQTQEQAQAKANAADAVDRGSLHNADLANTPEGGKA